MNRQDFSYILPPHLIAQHPSHDRDASRMMLLDRNTDFIKHGLFSDIVSCLNAGDCLVINDTKVIPARLIGRRIKTDGLSDGAAIEMLLHRPLDGDRWEVLFKPGKKACPGDVIQFGDGLLKAQVERITQDGLREVALNYEGSWNELLDRLGEMPLPPYITEKPRNETERNRYQTVYATHAGSVAAPTAGLHFTPKILQRLEEKGIKIAHITLHVGLGTFRPVKADDIMEHHMHSEFYRITPETAEIINHTKQRSGRVIAVGTTSCRTLESAASPDGTIFHGEGWTDIFIYPGYRFKMIDGLLTNFHLPESTLLMLVSAFYGQERTLTAYQTAIEQEYRFYSFGDCMLIV